MKEKIRDKINQAIVEKTFSACAVGIVQTNGNKFVVPGGKFTFDTSVRVVQENTIFDVASITKSIPTSSLALKLIDEGRLRVEDKLINFVPEFNNSNRKNILIKHLLTQTLDYDFRLSAYKDKSADEILDVIFTTEFKSKPGTKFFVTNATSILLGLVVERIFNEPLYKLGEKYLFKPLKMTRTTFNPLQKFKKAEIVPTEIQEWRGGLVQGEVHDESAYVLNKKIIVGSAGVFSTVPDILNFLEMLLNNGVINGQKYFSPKIMKQIQTNQLSDIDQYAGLGWELNQPRYMGKHCSDKTFGKTGFTGCVCVCDIERGVGFVILSNYTYPVRKPDAIFINKFRSDIADIVFENL
ncbi:MAG: serine hydrolase [Patescibacteria group bacterium]